MKRRFSRLLAMALVAVTAASGLSVASPAAAAPAKVSPGNKLIVKQNSAGTITIEQGAVLQAGQIIKAEFSSTYELADPQILELRNGVSLTEVDTQLELAGAGGTVGANAIDWFTQNTTNRGGLSYKGYQKFDRTLPPGTYHIVQMRPTETVKPSTTAVTFTVIGSPNAMLPVLNQRLTVVNPNGPDKFSAYKTKYAPVTEIVTNGPITTRNGTGGISSSRELHYFDWTQVEDGTTPEEVCASFSGGPSPFVENGGKQAFGTLSTQQVVNYYLNVPVGQYWVTGWVPDSDSGLSHALEHLPQTDPAAAPVCEGVMVQVVPQGTSKKDAYRLAA